MLILILKTYSQTACVVVQGEKIIINIKEEILIPTNNLYSMTVDCKDLVRTKDCILTSLDLHYILIIKNPFSKAYTVEEQKVVKVPINSCNLQWVIRDALSSGL